MHSKPVMKLWEGELEDRLLCSMTPIMDINTSIVSVGSSPSSLLTSNGLIYFIAETETTGSELWLSDGTSSGARLVCDIQPGSDGSGITNLVAGNGEVFFVANNGDTGPEL